MIMVHIIFNKGPREIKTAAKLGSLLPAGLAFRGILGVSCLNRISGKTKKCVF